MVKVNSVEASSNSLAEAKERTEAMLIRNNESKEYNFDERLQEAITQVWQRNQKAREKITETKKVAKEELDYIRNCHDCGVFDDRYYSLLRN